MNRAVVLEFRRTVVRPTLQLLTPEIPYTDAAENLLVGTALQESWLEDVLQAAGGPAIGFYQIEPATRADVYSNFLKFHPEIGRKVNALSAGWPSLDDQLLNPFYATAIARVIYYRVKEALPAATDMNGLAHYWKNYYNTPQGAGFVSEWLSKYIGYS